MLALLSPYLATSITENGKIYQFQHFSFKLKPHKIAYFTGELTNAYAYPFDFIVLFFINA
jgi:hypothetical protein